MTPRKKLRVVTLGCSKNTVDTEHLLASLPADAFAIVEDDQPVDILLVNTCGFIGDAKEESVEAILAAVEEKKASLEGELKSYEEYDEQLEALLAEVMGNGGVIAWHMN